jgi:acyl-CoA thioesterase-1
MGTMILALALLSAAPLPAAARDRSTAPRIVVLGDSLASGKGIGAAQAFPAVLQERLDQAKLNYYVVNAGVSRETSGDALRRLDAALRGDVRVLIVELGANDSIRGVPVERLKANLSRIIETAQARRIAVMLCAMEALPVHGWDYSVAFHQAYPELATKFDVPLVPFVLRNMIGNTQMMQPDMVHPNAAGARAIADIIWPYLKPLVDGHTVISHQSRR